MVWVVQRGRSTELSSDRGLVALQLLGWKQSAGARVGADGSCPGDRWARVVRATAAEVGQLQA